MKIGAFTLLFFMMGLIMGGVIISSVWLDNETKEVDCFDKYGNKILDQVCLDEPLTDNKKFIVGFFGIWILIIFTSIGITIDQPIPGFRY